MRLLHTTKYELHEHRANAIPEYAILSHRWCRDGEITLQMLKTADLLDGSLATPQLEKIRGACKEAARQGLEWVWIDSCCIDKTTSEELARSIRSMFQWYRKAEVCYTYLPDVDMNVFDGNKLCDSEGKPSEWFSRGWTLQELIAPRKMIFFDKDWNAIGDRDDLALPIQTITRIDSSYLKGEADFRTASIATRMSWLADRRTQEPEDLAYSMLGILDVSLVPMYGEGHGAWMRLQRELLDTRPDESIFAWTAPPGTLPRHGSSPDWSADEWGLLAPYPECFRDSHDITIGKKFRHRPPGSISMTREGVRFPMVWHELKSTSQWFGPLHFILPFSPLAIEKYVHSRRKVFSATLNCWRKDEKGKENPVMIFLSRDGKDDLLWRRCLTDRIGLDTKMYKGSMHKDLRNPSTVATGEVTILQPFGVNHDG